MERRVVAASIRQAWDFLERAGLAEIFASPDPLSVDPEFRAMLLGGRSGHSELYAYCIRNSYYTFLLFDHSFFQFSWLRNDHVRFAYYPNPHVGGDDSIHRFRRYRGMVEAGDLPEEDFLRLVQASSVAGAVPIFRYENAPSQYRSLVHPCSHLHIGVHGDNRWALRRVLSPLAFTMLIVKHYYPAEWGQGVPEGSTDGLNVFENELAAERASCQLIDDECFSTEESRSFYIF